LNGFFKVNWDAAVDTVNNKMGIGGGNRDDKGEVLATLSAPKDYIIVLDIAEARWLCGLLIFVEN
jgi:hypothetical protein